MVVDTTTRAAPVPAAGAFAAGADQTASRPHRSPRWVERWGTGLALAWFAVLIAILYAPFFAFGLIYYESDTLNWYLPIREYVRQSLLRGELPLWAPEIYGGFPLFADGEAGVLFPINLALNLLLPAGLAHVVQEWCRLWLAAAFTYWFARELRLGRLASAVAGLVFTFGSFLIGHLHHTNIGASAIWLPAVLAAFERARRASGSARWGWTALGGAALGSACLGLHVQPVMMTVMTLAAWTMLRLVPEQGRGLAALARHLVSLPAIAIGIGAVALGLAAGQLAPLYELSRQSFRGEGVTYSYATNYGPTPFNLITLLLPTFFQGIDFQWWALWSRWESTVYVGIAPLCLAVIGLLASRRREAWFFAVLAAVGLLLTLGDHGPIKLFWLLWQIPGFSVIRAPGRFSYLVVFAAALLAAYGAHWLWSSDGWTRGVGRWLRLTVAVTAILVAVGVGLALREAHGYVSREPGSVARQIRDDYLSLPKDPRYRITPDTIVDGLRQSLDPLHPRNEFAVGLLLCSGIGLWGWSRLRRWSALASVTVIGIVSLDLLVFATTFHPPALLNQVTRPDGVGAVVGELPPGLDRHYHRGSPPSASEANKLINTGRHDVGGYSSLEMTRVMHFLNYLHHNDGALLDLASVRYVITRREALPTPEYNGVQYDVGRPMMIGGSSNPNSRLELVVDAVEARELRLVGLLRGGRDYVDDDEVGEVIVTDNTNIELRYLIRAGREIADESLELPDATPARHRLATVAFFRPQFGQTSMAPGARLLGYHAGFSFDQPRVVTRVHVRFFGDQGQMQVVGVALQHADGQVTQVTRKAKYRRVYGDDTAVIDENRAVGPRAFLVHAAVAAPPGVAGLVFMAEGDFDPRRQAMVDVAVPPTLGDAPASDDQAVVTAYQPRRVTIQTRSATDGVLVLVDVNFPGWRAYVDGVEQPVITTDYIFRGVVIPPGDHLVEFSYDPISVKVGLTISALTLFGLLVFGGWLAWRAYRTKSTTIGVVAQ